MAPSTHWVFKRGSPLRLSSAVKVSVSKRPISLVLAAFLSEPCQPTTTLMAGSCKRRSAPLGTGSSSRRLPTLYTFLKYLPLLITPPCATRLDKKGRVSILATSGCVQLCNHHIWWNQAQDEVQPMHAARTRVTSTTVPRQPFLPDASIDFAALTPSLTVDSALHRYDNL